MSKRFDLASFLVNIICRHAKLSFAHNWPGLILRTGLVPECRREKIKKASVLKATKSHIKDQRKPRHNLESEPKYNYTLS